MNENKALLMKKCQRNALKIVANLSEVAMINENYFLECLQDINRNHYEDIVEERAVEKFCGYPLCPQELKDSSKQKFKISYREKKVYDISNRKNFCSDECFTCSEYIKGQLYVSPLWLRHTEKRVIFRLYNGNRKIKGDEVPLGYEKMDAKNDNSSDEKDISGSEGSESENYEETICELPCLTDRIVNTVKSWMTVETFVFLMGREAICDFVGKQEFENKLELYGPLLLKLKALDISNECSDDDPRVCYKQKVKKFYQGEDNVDVSTSIPIVPSCEKNSARRQIVAQRLSIVLPDILRILDLDKGHVDEGLKQLLETFRFSATNINFKIPEWTLISLIFIKILSMKEEKIFKKMESEFAIENVNILLQSYNLNVNYLNQVKDWLSESHIRRFFTCFLSSQ